MIALLLTDRDARRREAVSARDDCAQYADQMFAPTRHSGHDREILRLLPRHRVRRGRKRL